MSKVIDGDKYCIVFIVILLLSFIGLYFLHFDIVETTHRIEKEFLPLKLANNKVELLIASTYGKDVIKKINKKFKYY